MLTYPTLSVVVHRLVGPFDLYLWTLLTSFRILGDTKAGTLVGMDRYGNKYFENQNELPRTLYFGAANIIAEY